MIPTCDGFSVQAVQTAIWKVHLVLGRRFWTFGIGREPSRSNNSSMGHLWRGPDNFAFGIIKLHCRAIVGSDSERDSRFSLLAIKPGRRFAIGPHPQGNTRLAILISHLKSHVAIGVYPQHG